MIWRQVLSDHTAHAALHSTPQTPLFLSILSDANVAQGDAHHLAVITHFSYGLVIPISRLVRIYANYSKKRMPITLP
jgi:hypothetical protein